MIINLPKSQYLQMVTHSFHEMPYEACGLLVIRDGVLQAIPCQNDEPAPDSFTICVEDHERILNSGLPIVGTYHSHPRGMAVLSAGDLEMLPPNQIHFVIGMTNFLQVRAWRIEVKTTPFYEYLMPAGRTIRRVKTFINDDPFNQKVSQ